MYYQWSSSTTAEHNYSSEFPNRWSNRPCLQQLVNSWGCLLFLQLMTNVVSTNDLCFDFSRPVHWWWSVERIRFERNVFLLLVIVISTNQMIRLKIDLSFAQVKDLSTSKYSYHNKSTMLIEKKKLWWHKSFFSFLSNRLHRWLLSKMHCMKVFGYCVLGTILTLTFIEQSYATPLDDYVHAPDPTFNWTVIKTYQQPDYTLYILNFTSQKWFDGKYIDVLDWKWFDCLETFSNRPIWWHYLCISIPHKLTRPDAAFMLIDGGSNNNG